MLTLLNLAVYEASLNHRVNTGSGAHPASNPMGTMGFFPGVEAAGGVELYNHSSNTPSWRGTQSTGTTLPLPFISFYLQHSTSSQADSR
jgi:hypothetical protein